MKPTLVGPLAWVVLGMALFVAPGCGDPLKRAELLEEVRPLGVRVEVAGDPERASPRAGEEVNVRFLVRGPGETPALTWTFAACEAEPVMNGLPRCAGPVFAAATEPLATVGEPQFRFTVPPESKLQGAERLLVQGLFCVEGSPEITAGAEAVAAGACSLGDPRFVSIYVPVEREPAVAPNSANQNPSLTAAELQLDGLPWTRTEGSPCEDPAGIRVTSGSAHSLAILVRDTDRETLVVQEKLEPERETLVVSSVATAGALEREQSYLEATAAQSPVILTWSAPVVNDAPSPVTFYLVLRDLRGGGDWTERTVCVEP